LRGAMFTSTDTIAALATPVGTSAIAVVRASGPQVAALLAGIFQEAAPPRQVRHADYRDLGGKVIDDALFVFFAGPNSFTGEDTMEVFCHGSPFIAQMILADLFARGCRPAEAGEFTRRAFLNGRMDLSQAEAVMDVIHAQSERALAVANQQLRGSLKRKMDNLIALLINVLANIEAYIDFPEEDLPEENRQALIDKLQTIQAETGRLIATRHYGDLLRGGLKTVILGEPNAGKSSLLNRLVGHERALVSPDPGTTRDYLEERLVVGAHSLRLVDTAGLNPAAVSLEMRGIEKTLEQAATADLFLWVVDSTQGLPALPPRIAGLLTPANTMVVFNKNDLPDAMPRGPLPSGFSSISISALHGQGLDGLLNCIARLADAFQVSVGDEIVAINARHARALEMARAALEAGMLKLRRVDHKELLASDLREAMAAFGEIAGRVDHERVLDAIFAGFCIGK